MTPRSRRLLSALTGAAGVLAACAPLAAAAPAPSCATLTGAKTLADTQTAKVVRVTSHDQRVQGARIYGCAKPGGAVRLLGIDGIVDPDVSFITDQSTALSSVAGPYVTLIQAFDTEANAGPDSRTRVDLRTGRSSVYYSAIISNCGTDTTPPVAEEVLGADGRLAVLYAVPPGDTCGGYRTGTQSIVRAMRPDGRLQVLDLAPAGAIPAGSLTLTGVTAGWDRAGVVQSARIGGGFAASTAVAPKRTCTQLRHLRNLSPRKRLLIAKVGHAFVGCEPGSIAERVYTLGAAYGPSALKIDKVASVVVAYTFTAGHRVTKGVLSLETGAGSPYWEANLAIDCTKDFQAATPPPSAIALNTDAGLVATFSSPVPARGACYPNAGQTLVAGFAGGDPIVYDLAPAADIPPSSLKLAGRTVSWLRAGVAHHATQ